MSQELFSVVIPSFGGGRKIPLTLRHHNRPVHCGCGFFEAPLPCPDDSQLNLGPRYAVGEAPSIRVRECPLRCIGRRVKVSHHEVQAGNVDAKASEVHPVRDTLRQPPGLQPYLESVPVAKQAVIAGAYPCQAPARVQQIAALPVCGVNTLKKRLSLQIFPVLIKSRRLSTQVFSCRGG